MELPEAPTGLGKLERQWFNIRFDFNSFDIAPAYGHQLQTLTGLFEQNPQATIKIIGHTDNIGSASYNQGLSARRSMAVAKYLKDHGVEDSRIETFFFGETQPIHANSSEYGRTLNRRVEFVLQYEPELNANYRTPDLVEN
jgi:outer membrane protein OmpA-like peptidoglycan-associated protein